uniref:Uncharacterized protein n=1 Tax=Avena sativa TaxID=4498 RepID=A0ACD5X2X9_AVESA
MGLSGQDTVVLNMERILNKVTKPVELKHYSIYRVPKNVRDSIEKKHYEPRLVSIGPYHRKKEHLRAMEERKHLYLQNFLDDSPSGALQECVDAIRSMEAKARACYFESPLLSSEEFVEMLLLDGCFILQFFIQWFCGKADPVFTVAWNLPLLHTDLLMLENQIPYFVLQRLYGIYTRDPDRPVTARPKQSLIRTIAEYFYSVERPAVTNRVQLEEDNTIDHLLHLYYCHFISPPDYTYTAATAAEPKPPRTVRCAKELTLHGVKFLKKKKTSNILDVSFSKDGVFEIPHVAIEESTCSTYMNLVAFEMSRDDVPSHFTSFAVLLDYLVNTADDVLILHKAGIIENKLSNDEEAADFFNQLRRCSYIDYKTHYLAHLYLGVDEFCHRDWPRYKASLRRDYLSTPWAVVAFSFALLFAGFTIFSTVLSILQTFFNLYK